MLCNLRSLEEKKIPIPRDDFSFTKKSIQVQVFVSFIQDFDFLREMYKNCLLIRIFVEIILTVEESKGRK